MKRYLHLPESEYRAIEALSATGMTTLLRSPAHYAWSQTHPREPSPEMTLGTAIHRAVLEPARFDACYVRATATDGRTKEYKAEKEEAARQGKILLKPDDYTACTDIAKAVYDNELAASLLSQEGTAETSFVWEEDTERGTVPLKARLDFIGGRGVVDLKSCDDARLETFERKAFDLGYHIQAYLYLEAISIWQVQAGIEAPPCDFWWIAVERAAPYGILVYKASQETLRWGKLHAEQAMHEYQRAVNRGLWPAYEQRDPIEINPPSWWTKRHQLA